MDLRAGLDLLVRVDADAREDDALGADRHLVADRDSLVEPRVRAQVARAADDRALDDRAASDVSARLDDRALDARALAQRRVRAENRVRPDARLARDAAVVPDEGGPFELVEVVELDALADPDVAAELDAGDRELDPALERVVVRLPVLVEVADVLPVAVEHAAVERPAHLEQQREELLREVERPVGRDVPQALGVDHVDARVDRVGEDLPPRRLLEEALDPCRRRR